MKRGINSKMSNTVFMVSFAVLCVPHRYTDGQQAPPSCRVQNECQGFPQAKEVSKSLLKQCDRILFYLYDMYHHTLEIVLKIASFLEKLKLVIITVSDLVLSNVFSM